MLNKMLVIVFTIDFYSQYSQNPVFQFVPISNTQC